MSLTTPDTIRTLQRKLYAKTKWWIASRWAAASRPSSIWGAIFIGLKFRHSRLLPAGISAVASDDHNADGIPQR